MSMGGRLQRDKAFVSLVCTVLFAGFAFCYLYFYQDALLMAAQHLLSNGMTSYNRTVGAVTITLILLVAHIVVSRFYSPIFRTSAAGFMPEAFLLAAVTSFSISGDGDISCGARLYSCVAAAVLSMAFLLFYKTSGTLAEIIDKNLFPIQRVWINVLFMAFLLAIVGLLGNGDKALHAQLRMEQRLMEQDWHGALDVVKGADKASANMTMLTAYALSRENRLPESLFEYPVTRGSQHLLPRSGGSRAIMYPEKAILRHAKRAAAADYRLCGCLLDKKLDKFARMLAKYHTVDSTLPKHYREALVLYVHTRTNPCLAFRNSVAEADFQDFSRMENEAAGSVERLNRLRDVYGNTYWHYYATK